MGAIAALLHEGPVNLACDNAGVCKRLQRILKGEKAPAWALVRDGDIWSQIHRLAQQRGLESCAVTKVKSHIQERQVEQYGMTSFERRGNEHADVLASQGRDATRGHAALSTWLLQAKSRAVKVLARVHAVFAASLREAGKLRADPLVLARQRNARLTVAEQPQDHDAGLLFQDLQRTTVVFQNPRDGDLFSVVTRYLMSLEWADTGGRA